MVRLMWRQSHVEICFGGILCGASGRECNNSARTTYSEPAARAIEQASNLHITIHYCTYRTPIHSYPSLDKELKQLLRGFCSSDGEKVTTLEKGNTNIQRMLGAL